MNGLAHCPNRRIVQPSRSRPKKRNLCPQLIRLTDQPDREHDQPGRKQQEDGGLDPLEQPEAAPRLERIDGPHAQLRQTLPDLLLVEAGRSGEPGTRLPECLGIHPDPPIRRHESPGGIDDVGPDDPVAEARTRAVLQERVGDRLRRQVPRTEEHLHDDADQHEATKRDRHRRQRLPDQGACCRAERQREHPVRDRHDPPQVERAEPEAVIGDGDERTAPDGHRPREQRHRRKPEPEDQADLRQRPPVARHALRPREPMRSLLDLSRDQRRTEEDAEQERDHHVQRDHELQAVEPAVEGILQQRAILTRDNRARVELSEGSDDPRPGEQREDADRRQPDQRREGLRPMLTPRNPDHDPTSDRVLLTARRVWSPDPSRPPR